ncbi:MAG TPA: NnrS family protein [Burkholderiales bacterium]
MAEPARRTAAPKPSRGARPPLGLQVFYPAATAYGALVLPASVLSMTGVSSLPGLGTPAAHAHEMLYGFALAVVAGNQLGPTPWSRLAPLLALWGLGRIAFLVAPFGLVAALADVLFAAGLVWRIVPRLYRAVKKVRNYALPVVLTAIGASAIAVYPAQRLGGAAATHMVLVTAVLLFALLLLFMGGRLIAPAVAGQYYRQGEELETRVQPGIEAVLIVAMLAAIVISPFAALPWAAAVAGCACIVAGVLAAARLVRWRLWGVRGRPDLFCLGAGYAWLALGLVTIGFALLANARLTAALHLVTIGSLGSLTLNVMALTWAARAQRNIADERLPVWGTFLVAAATVARVAADFAGDPRPYWWLAGACWSGAFVLLLITMAKLRRPAARKTAG